MTRRQLMCWGTAPLLCALWLTGAGRAHAHQGPADDAAHNLRAASVQSLHGGTASSGGAGSWQGLR